MSNRCRMVAAWCVLTARVGKARSNCGEQAFPLLEIALRSLSFATVGRQSCFNTFLFVWRMLVPPPEIGRHGTLTRGIMMVDWEQLLPLSANACCAKLGCC